MRWLGALLVLGVGLTFVGCLDEGSNLPGSSGSTGSAGSSGGSSGTSGPRPPSYWETPPPTEVVCKQLPPLASGTCSFQAATSLGTGTVITAGTVLAPDTIYRGGSVVVDGQGVIQCVGCGCAPAAGAAQVTCPQGVVSPALINTHDHITYSATAPVWPMAFGDGGFERFEHRNDWRTGEGGHSYLDVPGGASHEEIRWGELRFLLGGSVATVGSGGEPGLLRNLDKEPWEEGLSQNPVFFDTFPLGDTGYGDARDYDCNYPHVVYADQLDDVDSYEPHVAEGIKSVATNEFKCLSSQNPDHDIVIAKTAILHGVGLTPAQYTEMAQQGTKLVWSPRSNVSLYGNTATVTEADNLGVVIALGTDWLASGSMNLLRELHCADDLNASYFDHHFTDEQLWKMVTLNAAIASATDDVIGSLQTRRQADITIFNGAARTDYRAVIEAAPQDVALVMRGGKILYGDAELVADASCDALDVCGTAKKVCLQSELGESLATLQGNVGADYPAFFCGTPDSEPSCAPQRWTSVNFSNNYTAGPTAGDADGDGLRDGSDDCPAIFNPIRPMDNRSQGDADHDGIGDACDRCPLDPTNTCAAVDANDLDLDGVFNAADNCPRVANPDQADADGDGKGDACDACPDSPNPGSQACTRSVYEIKTGAVTEGTVLGLDDLLVTAVFANGFYVQVPEDDPGYAGPDNSGLNIYLPGADVTPGQIVNIDSGDVKNFFGELELEHVVGVHVVPGRTATPTPVLVAPSEIATGGSRAAALDAVLVQVTDVSVTDASPPPVSADPLPTNEFAIDSGLRVDDLVYLTSPFPTRGDRYASITGVLGFGFYNTKLEPRSAADVVFAAPGLSGFSPLQSFVRVGQPPGLTFPGALQVTLSRPATADTLIAVTSPDPAIVLADGGGVVIQSGDTSANVVLSATAPTGNVVLHAALGGVNFSAAVRALDGTEQPNLVSLSPSPFNVVAGGSAKLTATLDIPAPPGGTAVALSVSPNGGGSLSASVTVPADALSAPFTFTDLLGQPATVTGTCGTGTASADSRLIKNLVINEVDYDTPGTDSAEFIELKNPGAVPVPLAGVHLVLANGGNNGAYGDFDLSSLGTIAPGQYAVVGAPTVLQLPDGGSLASLGVLTADLGALEGSSTGQNLLQNGSPDGVALVDSDMRVVLDALSYAGSMTASQLPGLGPDGGAGLANLVEGTRTLVKDNNTDAGSLCRVPDGTDTNDASVDWHFCTVPTPGFANLP